MVESGGLPITWSCPKNHLGWGLKFLAGIAELNNVYSMPRFRRAWWLPWALGIILAWGFLTAARGGEEDLDSRTSKAELAKTADQASPDKKPATPAPPKRAPAKALTDYDLLLADYRASGALKFYDLTEDLLRAGQFERAFSRYLFLKSQIRGQALYAGLTPMVDQRLHFLRRQMCLGEEAVSVLLRPPARKYQKPRPAKRPPLAKDTTPSGGKADHSSQASVIPGAVTPEKNQPPEVQALAKGREATGKAAASEDDKEKAPAQEEQETSAEPEKEKEKAAPPPPSFWEKAKRKLMFWKKT